jgi:hypothetical protein
MIIDTLQTFMFIHCRYMLSVGAHMCTNTGGPFQAALWHDMTIIVWFDVFTALLIKMTFFWNIIICCIGHCY